MKIIEALKQIKDLNRKVADIQGKVQKNCCYLSNETPTYGANQKDQIAGWLQSVHDMLKEILRLRIAINRTNLITNVAIELGDITVTKTIAEWVIRRRELAKLEAQMWGCLSDRGLREGTIKQSNGELAEVKIIRCFDPAERDKKLDAFQSEPIIIDSKLEIINAITDLIE